MAPFFGIRLRDHLADTSTELSMQAVAAFVEIIPKGADVQVYRTGAICLAQFPHPLPRKHERYAATVVSLHA